MDAEHRPISFAEVRSWDDQTRWELLDGHAYAMGGPSVLHQDVVLALRLAPQLQGGPCRLYSSPLDVKLSEYDLVQPDLLVACQKEQIKPGYIDGPPHLVVEVYCNQGGLFARLGAFSESGLFRSQAFPGLKLDLAELFSSLPSPPPPEEVTESVPACRALS